MVEELVILVDKEDNALGLMPKMQAHEQGLLHRAFSVFILNDNKELLLQQRALGKYHSPGLWTNTCCSHPRNGETISEAANRRLEEEMGMSCDMESVFNFVYKADMGNGLTEHELDYVLIGRSNANPVLNSEEVENYKWVNLDDLALDLNINADQYTAWFKIIFDRFHNYVSINKKL
jgi:isopentenyl-diphosphate delta-isomerase